jgi:hypothetical protein
MANSLPTDTVQRITQCTKVRLNRISHACGMGLVEVVSNTTSRAGIFTSFKQANGGSAYLPTIGALKFNSVGMGIHRLTSRGLG